MSKLIPSAPYFKMCDDDCGEAHGFIVIPNLQKVSIYSKEAGKMQVNGMLERALLKKDETLELLEQIESSKLPKKISPLDLMYILHKNSTQTVRLRERDRRRPFLPRKFRYSKN